MAVELTVDRELRSIKRSIGRIGIAGAVGAASVLSAIPYAIPTVVYW
jgi:hypothetical protein